MCTVKHRNEAPPNGGHLYSLTAKKKPLRTKLFNDFSESHRSWFDL